MVNSRGYNVSHNCKMYFFMVDMLHRTCISENEMKVAELHGLYSFIVTLNNRFLRLYISMSLHSKRELTNERFRQQTDAD